MRLLVSLFALFTVYLAPCRAEINEYDIEIVIFEDLTGRYINSELWPRIEHAIDAEDNNPALISEEPQETDGLAEYPDNNDVINIARNSSTTLKQHAKKLDASGRYRVLVHKAWRQAGLDADSAIDIDIDSSKHQHTNDLTGTLRQISTQLPGSGASEKAELDSSVSGKVKIILGRYLHIYTDLIYRKPSSSNEPVAVSLTDSRFSEFQIKSHRRMRSKELHYLDHPLVGILVMALPVEAVEADEQKAQLNKSSL